MIASEVNLVLSSSTFRLLCELLQLLACLPSMEAASAALSPSFPSIVLGVTPQI
jgi:hypothetical protein